MDKVAALEVRHRISLAGSAEIAAAALAGLPGLVQVEGRGQRLDLAYDLRLVNLDSILTVVRLAGIQPKTSMLARLHRAWIRFTDDNALSSATDPGHGCCSRPPKGR
ncbi:hypothetical protein [Magnetospirillum moscoviense]|uniref:Cation transporter n=1 Tax=Magnetospirillum moscoviense TaxID=1437059 RepID=A0A178N0V5_9PROT|nr:hypothetical protein [Magnetospirillum moscoviense]MBF0324873.1 hypothetical protein [Alphaproteobacteria bacterium]OAN63191.1 hypothetical protein A6A05_06475 [Magnetospirillum moscoviense]